MPITSHNKLSIALEQLEQALRLSLEGGSTWSILTLAGAAEEILGQYLKRNGVVSAIGDICTTSERIYEMLFADRVAGSTFANRANLARNAAKHFSDAGEESFEVDAEQEAADMLDRAVTNFHQLVILRGADERSARLAAMADQFRADRGLSTKP